VRRTLASIVAAFAFVLLALPAAAIDDITIPLTTVVRGAEGESFLLAEVATGSDAGCEADVWATAQNNESVHIGNDLIVSSGGGQVLLSDVESAIGKVTTANGTLVLGDTITVTLVLGQADEGRPRSVFSGGMTVTVSCIPDETTTTTTIPETTTTTAPETTTTTEAITTTTTTLPETTTTTVPPFTSSSVLGTTTTTLPVTTSSVAGTSSTTVPPVTGSTLPFTGPEDVAGLAMAGTALLLLGGAIMAATREQNA
jgi:predicted extracellular nuclease